jgi:hypothetical protein
MEKVTKKAIIQPSAIKTARTRRIKPNWPGIEYRQMSTATWGYGARGVVRPEFAQYLTAA